ncbi:MAG: sugar phosphate isomerase/epimerase [Treponema sp.]|jgi:sugar phosphate isomerase/epimerase|nr:sugar phosphate isomerase/epimerase [Treponema sp.]
MKLSFTTLGCPDWSFAKILDEAEKMGYSGIEIRGLEDRMLAEEITQFFPENREATLAALKAHHLEMVGFGSSVRFDPAEKFDSMVAEGKRAIDVSQFMGIPAIRIFGDKIPQEEREAEVIARIAKGAGILAEYGEAKGVKVLLETHGDINTLERVRGIFDQVKSKNFRLLWDVAHTDFTYEDNFVEFYRPLKHLIVHTHFKDHIRGTPGDEKTYKLCRIGEGQIPITAIVKQLLADGYKGYFSLEWEKKWHPELPGAEIAYPDFVRVLTGIK